MIQRFVHYITSVQHEDGQRATQPVMLGVTTVNPPAMPGEKPILGHSFSMDGLSKTVQESILWGVSFLMIEPKPFVALGGVETRRSA